jgi:hypothetical protein
MPVPKKKTAAGIGFNQPDVSERYQMPSMPMIAQKRKVRINSFLVAHS